MRDAAAASTLISWLASSSLATDLANGAPEGTALRGTLVAIVAAERLGLAPREQAVVAFSALFRYLGCTSYALEESRALGDEHEAARLLAPIDRKDNRGLARVLTRELGRADSFTTRARRLGGLALQGVAFRRGYEASHCEASMILAARLGACTAVEKTLGSLYERWDGGGGPAQLRGEAIPFTTRIVQIAREATVHQVLETRAGPRGCLETRAGGQLDPALCKVLLADAAFAESLVTESLWEPVLARLTTLGAHALSTPSPRTIAEVIADFVDAKCPVFLGHSRAVAALIARAVPDDGALAIAALLHDVGRVAVSNRIWMTSGPLDPIARSRVDLHAAVGEGIVARLDATLGALVGAHHGRGGGTTIGRRSALLHAADVMVALGEARPHRAAHDPAVGARILDEAVSHGQLDPDAVRILRRAASDAPPPARGEQAAALTPKEQAVLKLVARGLSNKEVGSALGISPRTVQTHTIHAYDKLGIRTRAGAALRATELGLL